MQRPAREEHLPFRAAFLQTGLPCSSADKESACNAGDPGLIPGWERSPGEGIGYPFQYSGLENFMDCIVHGVTKSPTQLSLHFCRGFVLLLQRVCLLTPPILFSLQVFLKKNILIILLCIPYTPNSLSQ